MSGAVDFELTSPAGGEVTAFLYGTEDQLRDTLAWLDAHFAWLHAAARFGFMVDYPPQRRDLPDTELG